MAIAMVALAAVVLPGAGAFAQASDMQILLDRISRLERDIRTLNQQIARGPNAAASTAPLGTPLQTAPAPQPSGGAVQESALSRIMVKIDGLEQEIRQATGASESLSYRVDQMSARLDTLVSDLEYRLARLERGALNGPAGAGDGAGGVTPRVSTVGKPAAVSKAGEMPLLSDRAPQGRVGKNGTYVPSPSGGSTLGSISQKNLDQFAAPGTPAPSAGPATPTAPVPSEPVPNEPVPSAPKVVSVLPDGTPAERYKYAFGLMSQARYGEAEVALKEFIAKHGDDPLANNARYWLGETFYVRKSFMDAAQTFFEAYKAAPAGPKAADSLLKLGMAMANLDKTEEACATFGKLRSEFVDLKPTIKKNLDRQTKRLKCP